MISLNVNEATLIDSPFYSPDVELAQPKIASYFSMKDPKIISPFSDRSMAEYRFVLSGTKIVRTRTVYSVLTLLSEVSGFADVVIVAC